MCGTPGTGRGVPAAAGTTVATRLLLPLLAPAIRRSQQRDFDLVARRVAARRQAA